MLTVIYANSVQEAHDPLQPVYEKNFPYFFVVAPTQFPNNLKESLHFLAPSSTQVSFGRVTHPCAALTCLFRLLQRK
jgi:hypothetical protein